MPNVQSSTDVRSLAEARPGEALEIRCILFDSVRGVCETLGIRAGDRVRVEAATPARIGLTRPDGTGALLDARWAEFIQVASDPSAIRAA